MAVPIFAGSPPSTYGMSAESLAEAGQAIHRDAADARRLSCLIAMMLFQCDGFQ